MVRFTFVFFCYIFFYFLLFYLIKLYYLNILFYFICIIIHIEKKYKMGKTNVGVRLAYSSFWWHLLSRRPLPNLPPSYPHLPSFLTIRIIYFSYVKLLERKTVSHVGLSLFGLRLECMQMCGFVWNGAERKRAVPLRSPYNAFFRSKMAALRGRVVTECFTTCMFRQTSTASISTLPIALTGNKVSGVLYFVNSFAKVRKNVVLHMTWLWQKLNSIAEVV